MSINPKSTSSYSAFAHGLKNTTENLCRKVTQLTNSYRKDSFISLANNSSSTYIIVVDS